MALSFAVSSFTAMLAVAVKSSHLKILIVNKIIFECMEARESIKLTRN